jgi:hypothetical protein
MKPHKSFAADDEDRVAELTEAIAELMCESDAEISHVFSALMGAFSHYAAALDPRERQEIFRQLRENHRHFEENAELIAQQDEPLITLIPVVGRA